MGFPPLTYKGELGILLVLFELPLSPTTTRDTDCVTDRRLAAPTKPGSEVTWLRISFSVSRW